MNVQLLVNKGATRGKKIQLRHETTIIGRRRDCNLCIPSSEVSRRHCLLQFQDGCLTVEDLNSINGTFLNEERLADKSVVYPGDRLAIGPVHFTVQYERVAVEMRHHVGVDHIMFATDFPHIENEWPNSRPIIDEIYENVPADEKHKMWAGNAVKYFKLDA